MDNPKLHFASTLLASAGLLTDRLTCMYLRALVRRYLEGDRVSNELAGWTGKLLGDARFLKAAIDHVVQWDILRGIELKEALASGLLKELADTNRWFKLQRQLEKFGETTN